MSDILRFKSHLVVEKGIMVRTAEDYCQTIKRFIRQTNISNPSKDQVIDYLMDYHSKGYSYSYITNTTLALEHYLGFLGIQHKFDRPRKPKIAVEDWLTEQEIARMFVFCRNIREQTMLALLAYTGIRNLELCNLLVKNINFQSKTIFIKAGKGLKDGSVCISPIALDIINQYLDEYPRDSNETLLYSITGQREGMMMRQGAVRKHIKTIAKRSGIDRRVWVHLFRHSLAMNMLIKGCDIYSVKSQLRHEFLSTTEIYIKSNPQILRNNYEVFVPQYVWSISTQTNANAVFSRGYNNSSNRYHNDNRSKRLSGKKGQKSGIRY